MAQGTSGMAEVEAHRQFPDASHISVQPLGDDLFAVMVFADDGASDDLAVQAVAMVQVRGVLVGEPLLLSVAQAGV